MTISPYTVELSIAILIAFLILSKPNPPTP